MEPDKEQPPATEHICSVVRNTSFMSKKKSYCNYHEPDEGMLEASVPKHEDFPHL